MCGRWAPVSPNRASTHGYKATRDGAMAGLAKSWRQKNLGRVDGFRKVASGGIPKSVFL